MVCLSLSGRGLPVILHLNGIIWLKPSLSNEYDLKWYGLADRTWFWLHAWRYHFPIFYGLGYTREPM
jgi:hypothetical protein